MAGHLKCFLHSSFCDFIKTRCIRPNEQMIPGEFDQDKVQTQLKYTGVLETTRIRQQVCLHFEPSDCGCWNKPKLPLQFPAFSVDGEDC